MANSDKTRLAKIDAEIIDVQYLYQRELDREGELSPERRHLLASRGFKYRLDNLYAKRALLRKFIPAAPTKAMNYVTEMSRRRTEYDDVCEEYERALKTFANKIANVALVGLNLDNELELKCMRREIGAMKSLVSSKNRAVNNWLAKGTSTEYSSVLKTQYMPHRAKRAQLPEQAAPLALAPAMRIDDMSGDMQEIARASAACTAANVTDAAHSTPPDTYSASFAALNAEPAREDVSSGLRIAVESEDMK
jgi:hypothetical protein